MERCPFCGSWEVELELRGNGKAVVCQVCGAIGPVAGVLFAGNEANRKWSAWVDTAVVVAKERGMSWRKV